MRLQKILPRIAGLLGAGAGYVLWTVLYGNFEGSIAPDMLTHLKESDAFGTLMAFAAAFMVIGTLSAATVITNAVSTLAVLKRKQAA
jgi:hypothetical protein